MRKLRVALVAHGIHDEGGMERSLAELVRHSHDSVDFDLVSTRIAPDLAEIARWTPIRVPTRPVPVFFSSFYVRASSALRHLRTDLIHSMGALHARPSDLVSVQFCHRAFQQLPSDARQVDGGPLRALNRRLDLRLSLVAESSRYRPGRVRTFAAASAGVARELARFYPGVPTVVIPNGFSPAPATAVSAAERELVRARHGYGPDDVVALFLGGDWKRKGLSIAIDATARVAATERAPLHLAVVGPGDAAPHEHHASLLGIGDRVRFFGRTRVAHEYYAAADLFIFPTAYEAFPLVAIEAAAAGLPIIATRANGIEDLIEDGVSGLLVDRSADSVAAAMARLVSQAPTRSAMGRAAQAAASRFTWASAAQQTTEAYERLAADAR